MLSRTEYEDRIEYDDGTFVATLWKEWPLRFQVVTTSRTWQEADGEIVERDRIG